MTAQLEYSLHEAEKHLVRAKAEMARSAAKIAEAAAASRDPRLSQLAEVIAAHRDLLSHLSAVAISTFYSTRQLEPPETLAAGRLG